ncbi:MAG: hypothetical protein H7Z38_18450, partial [Rubrivivax sp.]|nr:hypothetical protein [Pyrinomonadaceae bacterium]
MPPVNLSSRRRAVKMLSLLVCLVAFFRGEAAVVAHPLGNFTVNNFARVRIEAEGVRVRYVVDMAEIPAFQESQAMDADRDGNVSNAESAAYLDALAQRLAEGLVLTGDGGARIPLRIVAKALSMPKGEGGLPTLRIECDFQGIIPESAGASGGAHRLRFE